MRCKFLAYSGNQLRREKFRVVRGVVKNKRLQAGSRSFIKRDSVYVSPRTCRLLRSLLSNRHGKRWPIVRESVHPLVQSSKDASLEPPKLNPFLRRAPNNRKSFLQLAFGYTHRLNV